MTGPRMRCAWLALALLATPVQAYTPPTRVQTLLLGADTRGQAMSALRQYADSIAGSAPAEAGEAWRAIGELHWRGAGDAAWRADSALAAFDRASTLRGASEERLALADVWISRNRPDELERVPDWLTPERMALADAPAARRGPVLARMAQAFLRAGRAPDAAALVRSELAWFAAQPAWMQRLAPALVASAPTSRDMHALIDAAVASRGDPGCVRWATAAIKQVAPDSGALLSQAMLRLTAAEAAFIEARGGSVKPDPRPDPDPRAERPPLTWRMPAVGATRARALIVLPPATRSLTEADSLIDGLRGRGFEVLVTLVRAADGSLPDPAGRLRADFDDQLASAWVRHGLSLAPRDTTGPATLVIGVAETAMPAALIAQHPAVRAVALLNPWPALPERGALAGRLLETGVPTLLQTSPEAPFANEYADQLAARLPATQVRVMEGAARGTGVAMLRQDPAALRRLLAWAETAAQSPRATPPRRPR